MTQHNWNERTIDCPVLPMVKFDPVRAGSNCNQDIVSYTF